ncbi:hypothetical protein ACP70R_045525 [Stipagrostis hirtigluma subsp. patula]
MEAEYHRNGDVAVTSLAVIPPTRVRKPRIFRRTIVRHHGTIRW